MYVQGLVVAYMIFQIVRKIFFGELRAAEYEVSLDFCKLIFLIRRGLEYIYWRTTSRE